MKIKTKTIRIAIYFILAVISLAPLLSEKYLFLLDCIPRLNEHTALDLFYGKYTPVGGGLPVTLISAIIPAEIFQKLLLFLILFLSGYSMHNLASKFTSSKTAQFYAGLLYMLNPYTYIRIVVGHWGILLAYAILPLAVKYFIEMLDKKDLKSITKIVLITAVVAFNSHTLFIAFIIFLILFLFRLCKDKYVIKPVAISFTLFLALNSYWLIPLLTAQKETILTHISSKDLEAFAPKADLFSLAGMYGFWRLGYVYAKDFLYPYWMYLFLVIFGLAVLGFIRGDKGVTLPFMAVWLVGFALASGIKGPFSHALTPLFEHTILKGMRDSQKFVTMLCLSYSCLGALGFAEIERFLKNKKPFIRIGMALVILLVPLVYSFTFFNGFAGQIKPTDFPKDWYEVNEFLNKDKDEFRVLFFPWHLYMTFHWLPNKDKCVANP